LLKQGIAKLMKSIFISIFYLTTCFKLRPLPSEPFLVKVTLGYTITIFSAGLTSLAFH